MIRSTIEKIESDVSTVKEDVNEIKESLQKNNIIIYTDRENYPTMNILDEEIDFKKEMNFIKLIYSYENKNKILIFPRHCSKVIS